MEEITYRWIEGEELESLEPIFEEEGWISLNPQVSRAYCAFDSKGTLLGFCAFQLMPFVGPEYVAIEHRGSGIAEMLADGVHKFLSEVKCRGGYLVADNPHSAKLAMKHGMVKVESPVFVKVGDGEGV